MNKGRGNTHRYFIKHGTYKRDLQKIQENAHYGKSMDAFKNTVTLNRPILWSNRVPVFLALCFSLLPMQILGGGLDAPST